MKILVFSDSHRKYQNMDEVLQRQNSRVSAVLFLGDGIEDIKRLEKKYSPLEFHYVCGNCDSGSLGESKKTVHLGGKKIFMTHGHLYSVKSGYERISYAADEGEADICLFGHTHVPAIFYYSKTMFLNPGSIAFPNIGGYPSYGMIEVSDAGVINSAIVSKQDDGYRILDVNLWDS